MMLPRRIDGKDRQSYGLANAVEKGGMRGCIRTSGKSCTLCQSKRITEFITCRSGQAYGVCKYSNDDWDPENRSSVKSTQLAVMNIRLMTTTPRGLSWSVSCSPTFTGGREFTERSFRKSLELTDRFSLTSKRELSRRHHQAVGKN